MPNPTATMTMPTAIGTAPATASATSAGTTAGIGSPPYASLDGGEPRYVPGVVSRRRTASSLSAQEGGRAGSVRVGKGDQGQGGEGSQS